MRRIRWNPRTPRKTSYNSKNQFVLKSSVMKEPVTPKEGEEEEERNWAELPHDVMSLVFEKLGFIDVMVRAQWVCSAWRKFSKEPHLYRSIDTEKWDKVFKGGEPGMRKLVREAVDRSCGQMTELTIESFATDDLLKYISEKLDSLRRLRLVYCGKPACDALIEMACKLPLLEEFELCYCETSKDVFEAVGNSCPRLKSFRLNCYNYSYEGSDEDALTIAGTMHELRHLDLFGSRLTDDGLRAILNGCPNLKSLDLRKCSHVSLARDLKRRCADRDIKLKLPKDPTDDYEYDIFPSPGEDYYDFAGPPLFNEPDEDFDEGDFEGPPFFGVPPYFGGPGLFGRHNYDEENPHEEFDYVVDPMTGEGYIVVDGELYPY